MFIIQKKTLFIAFLSVILTACGDLDLYDAPPDAPVETLTGQLIDGVVSGITYSTETQNGITNADGEYLYLAGETVVFSLGNVDFPPVLAKGIITPLDMVEGGTLDSPLVILIARLLQSLDSDANPDNGIEITKDALTATEGFTFDDFDNLDTFETALQSLLYLVRDAEVPLVVVSEEQARDHLEESLVAVGEIDAPIDEPPLDEPTPIPAPTYSLGGVLVNLTPVDRFISPDSFELINGVNSDSVVVAGATTFIFPTAINSGDNYDIAITTEPTDLDCQLDNDQGVMGKIDVIDITLTCINQWLGSATYPGNFDASEFRHVMFVESQTDTIDDYILVTGDINSPTCCSDGNMVAVQEYGLNRGEGELWAATQTNYETYFYAAVYTPNILFDAPNDPNTGTIWAVASTKEIQGDSTKIAVFGFSQKDGQSTVSHKFSSTDEIDRGRGIVTTLDGMLIVSGYTNATLFENQAPTVGSNFSDDVVIISVDPTKFETLDDPINWVRRINDDEDLVHQGGLVVDGDGDILLTYEIDNGNDYDTVLKRISGVDGSDMDLEVRFASVAGEDERIESKGLAVDSKGNIFTLARTKVPLDTDTIDSNRGAFWDFLLIKTNSDGAIVWSNLIGTLDTDYPTGGILINDKDEIFLSGYTSELIVGQTLSTRNIYALKVSTDGDVEWEVKHNPDPSGDDIEVRAMAFDRFGNILLAGENEEAFWPEQTFIGSTGFLVKLNKDDGSLIE